MTDVQVSSARRVGFTALALVAFWVVAFRGYWAASDLWHELGLYSGSGGHTVESIGGRGWIELTLIGLLLALIPTAFLHTSTSNRVLRKPERWVWLAGVCFVCACGYCYWLGDHDAENAYTAVGPIMIVDPNNPPNHGTFHDYAAQHLAARQAHQVSWLWLISPIIATTAFVIFGAWRRAVREAEVELVDEDE